MSLTNRLREMESPALRDGFHAPPKVCLVNDDDAVLVSLKFLFQSAGFVTRAYASGKSLLASALARRADCFVLDHKPRGLDGLNLARRLRNRGIGAPIVLTTGFRCGALETVVGAFDQVIATPRVDEDLIQHLLVSIEQARAILRRFP